MAGEAGRVGPAMPQFEIDHFKHARQIAINLTIPKSQRPKSGSRKPRITAHVARLMQRFIVLTAVHFDDQFSTHADEVNHVTLARRLAAKMKPAVPP